MTMKWPVIFGVSFLSGVLLGSGSPPFCAIWLLLIGFIPLAWVLIRIGSSWKPCIVATSLFGLGHNLVLAVALEFPLSFAVPLALALTLSWSVLGLVVGLLLPRLPTAWALVVIPAAATAVDFVSLLAIPIFGTAQSFVRAMAPWPGALAVTALAGHSALLLLLAAGETGIAMAIAHWRRRTLVIAGLAVAAVAASIGIGAWALDRSTDSTVQVVVAAAGWTYEAEGPSFDRPGTPVEQVDRLLAPLVRDADEAGASILVAPEVAFVAPPGEQRPLLERLSSLAADAEMILIVGYFDLESNTNHAVVIDERGEILGDYVKTHLIPGVEDYNSGSGEIFVAETGHGRIGVMICQDDNFTDLARAYGRQEVSILAVPTNDWRQVQEFHLQNSIFRTVETGAAMIRGATNGISAIIDAKGRVLARMDHHAEGRGLIVADLPISPGGTLYAWGGEWLSVLCAILLVVAGVIAFRRRDWTKNATARFIREPSVVGH